MKKSLQALTLGSCAMLSFLGYAQTPVVVKNSYVTNLYSYNGYGYFADNNQHPWFSDGTLSGTLALDTASTNNSADKFFLAGNSVYFPYNSSGNAGLWKTNNTPSGTSLVKQIDVGFTPHERTAFNNNLVFTASDGSSASYEPWLTDGTTPGTHMIANVQATVNYGSGAVNYAVVNSKVVYFTCDYWTCGTGSYRVWAYDGNSNVRIDGGFAISGINAAPVKLFSVGTTSYFGTTDGSGNNIIYQTDGNTFSYTTSIPKINGLVTNGTNIFTAGFDISTGWQLYKMDMNFTNLTMVKIIDPVPNSGQTILGLTVMNNKVYFFANDSIHGMELWQSDGTAAGTTLVKDILPGKSSSYPIYAFSNIPVMSVMCNKLWFNATDSVHGQELWVSDGTTSGTQMVADFCQGTCSSEIQEAAMSNGRFFFVAHDSLYNYKLYKIDECFTPFSVKDLAKEQLLDILIWPNPSSGQIHLTSAENIYSYIVSDVLGNEVKWEKLPQDVKEKNIMLPERPGVYFITVETSKGKATRKVIRE
jgi:ELWxxDGT repeat protein